MSADKDARIAELESRNKRIEDCLVHERTRVADLILTNEELERKLAEQQAALFTIRTIVAGCDSDEATRTIRHLQKHFDNQHAELDSLLAKAKEEGRKEAVPEGIEYTIASFDYEGGGVTTPTLTLYFADGTDSNELWALRDKAKAMLSAAPKPQGESNVSE